MAMTETPKSRDTDHLVVFSLNIESIDLNIIFLLLWK